MDAQKRGLTTLSPDPQPRNRIPKPDRGQSGLSPFLRVLTFVFVATLAHAQLSYSRGQNVSPAYEGWERNADGSVDMVFGYMNSNWEEEFDLPAGPENNIQPGGPDQGQPTHFFPRRNRFVFRVRVPKDFGEKELVWTLTTHGKTIKAYGTLRQDYFLDNMVLTSETGAIGARASALRKFARTNRRCSKRRAIVIARCGWAKYSLFPPMSPTMASPRRGRAAHFSTAAGMRT